MLTKINEMKQGALVVQNDDQYILNHCAKYLARTNTDQRHNFGQYDTTDPRGSICEAWRFPTVDTYEGSDEEDSYAFNKVTFVYKASPAAYEGNPSVIGTFSNLYT